MKLFVTETYYSCVEKAAEYIAKTGVSIDSPAVVFCEDKLTLSAESAIAKAMGGGSFGADVTSLGRYVSKRLKDSSALSKEGSAIVVKKVLSENADNLKTLSRLAFSPSFAFETSELIAQLKSAKITPEMLMNSVDGCPENIRAKILDLAVVFKGYEDFLKKKGLTDQSGILGKMPELIEKDEKLRNSRAIVVGFSSVTRQSAEAIKKLVEVCRHVDFFAVDGENLSLYSNEFSSFVSRTFGLEKIRLNGGESLEQKALLNGLFDHEQFTKVGLYSDKLTIYESHSVQEEAEYAALNIVRLVESGKYKFSDIAVAVGNLPEKRLMLKKAFGDYEIPCYLDEKRPLGSHPIARLTLSLLKNSARGGDIGEIKKIVSDCLFISDREKSDEFTRLIIGNSVTAKSFLDENYSVSDDLFLINKQNTIIYFQRGLKYKEKASAIVKKIKAFYEACGVEQNAEDTAKKLEEVGAMEERAFLLTALGKAYAALDDIAELLGDEVISVTEFSKLLSAAYNACEVGIIPQYGDGVYVAELRDCKHVRHKILFAFGLSGEIPFVKSDTALLLDGDIAELESLSVSIEPKISVVNRREKEATGIALATFEDKLFVSYSLMTPSGGQAVRSELVDYISAIFAKKNGEPLKEFNSLSVRKAKEKAEGERRETLESLGYVKLRPAFLSLVKDMDDFKNGATDNLFAASAFIEALKDFDEEYKKSADRLVGRANRELTIRKNLPTENYFEDGKVSASKIECFYSCPYKCFVKYCLGVKDKLTGDVRALDFGNVLHEIAEKFVEKTKGVEDDEEAEKIAEEVIKTALSSPDIQKFSRRGDYAYALKLTEKEGRKLCKNIYGELKASSFKPVGQEVWFSDWSEYKSLPLKTKKGVYKLYGKADRVDKFGKYVRIIDYKTGSAKDKTKEEKFYTGQNLQLYLYMNAFVRGGDEPAGAYYYAVKDDFKKPDDDKVVMFGKTVSSDEILEATDPNIKTTGKSDLINVKTDSRNGKLTGSVCGLDTMKGYMKYAKILAENAVGEIADGVIIASPYKEACDYCEYGGICGRDEETGFKTRSVGSVKPETIVAAAFAEENGNADGRTGGNADGAKGSDGAIGDDKTNGNEGGENDG